jgi:hypothetical protein
MRSAMTAAALVCSALLPVMAHGAVDGGGPAAAVSVPRPDAPGKAAARARWEVTVGTSPADGGREVSAVLPAAKVSGGSFGGAAMLLVARCEASETDVYFAATEYLGTEASQATVRMGTEPAREKRWHASADGLAMGFLAISSGSKYIELAGDEVDHRL